MALLERVSTLIRANLNDLIDKAEDPEKIIKQVILDMENQLIQVKTQVAMALADQHLLDKKRKEIESRAAEWMQKAELAIDKGKDDLARAALERSVSHQKLAEDYRQQEADQRMQVELLKSSLKTLTDKLAEAQTKQDLLITQHRRSRTQRKPADATISGGERAQAASPDPMEAVPSRSDTLRQVKAELQPDEIEEKFASLEKEDQIDRLLSELKAQRRSKT